MNRTEKLKGETAPAGGAWRPISVKWGDGVNVQCRMSIVLPKANEKDRAPWTVVDSVCVP
ncbi:hypothetical protein [Burkholderia stagnalis]|uniref:hypothetical protein n=1 Tax=Burkholderia stagnalis TaxID=1503054 RepID=UPI0012D8A6AE|nr:hypothetical protein [Burkholderia stagnalis]